MKMYEVEFLWGDSKKATNLLTRLFLDSYCTFVNLTVEG